MTLTFCFAFLTNDKKVRCLYTHFTLSIFVSNNRQLGYIFCCCLEICSINVRQISELIWIFIRLSSEKTISICVCCYLLQSILLTEVRWFNLHARNPDALPSVTFNHNHWLTMYILSLSLKQNSKIIFHLRWFVDCRFVNF